MPLRETEVEVFNDSGRDVPIDERIARKCISEVARQEACSFSLVEIVYVDEAKIQEINLQHLDHDYVTDIITFRYDEEVNKIGIESTLFCCAPRISEQSQEYDQSPETEFMRVLVHGLLHLAGYSDKTEEEQRKMREREEFYLKLLD